MAKLQVLIEVATPQVPPAVSAMMTTHEAFSSRDLFTVAEALLADLPGLGVEVSDAFGPIPLPAPNPELGPVPEGLTAAILASEASARPTRRRRGARAAEALSAPIGPTVVVPAEVTATALRQLEDRPDVVVWPSSRITLFQKDVWTEEEELFGLRDLATSASGTDCAFRPGVTVDEIRALLGVNAIWRDGFHGENVIVAILDDGVNSFYPVVGGHETLTGRRWGLAAIQSHGSMCAADILVAAPAARLYDYPFLGHPTSGGALAMFQSVLEQRRRDGTPHLTNNSYGFVGVPPQASAPNHEIWNLNHPVHRKVREVVAEGVACFFAAGNCGANCPSNKCHVSGIGPGRAIHASNSLAEVITVAAVNSRHERVGYSSEGPGMFERNKPDIAAYTHFFGNFGPGRPGGMAARFDNGTSAATPVACGVAATLLSAFGNLSPADLKNVLMASATDVGQPGRDFLTGAGVVNAALAYQMLRAGGRVPGQIRPQLVSQIEAVS